MFDLGQIHARRRPATTRPAAPARARRPRLECLEERLLLVASLAPIPDQVVPPFLGRPLPLDGGQGAPQTFSAQSDNPSVSVGIAQGQFMTIDVTHTAAGPGDISFAGPMTFQLFDDLTPLTTSRIKELIDLNFYQGRIFHRVATGFPGPDDYIVQGGSVNDDGTGTVNLPGFPFRDEFVQQLVFTGTEQLAMANAGDDTNESQFFITTGSPRSLDFLHTIFGQMVEGRDILQQMTQVQVVGTTPVSPLTMTDVTLSDTNRHGVLYIDTTRAQPGDAATVTVTATEPATGTTATRSFVVLVEPDDPPINTRPFLAPVDDLTVGLNQPAVFGLRGVDPDPGDPLTYIVAGDMTLGPDGAFQPVQNATASVDQSTGIVTVVPHPGVTGPINLVVGVRDQINRAGPGIPLDSPLNYDTDRITLTVTDGPPVPLRPIALPILQTIPTNTPSPVQLAMVVPPPDPGNPREFELLTDPIRGTISDFDPATGHFIYSPNLNFTGVEFLEYQVVDLDPAPPVLDSAPAQVTILVVGGETGAVRQIGRVLVVTPPPRTDDGANTVSVSELADRLLITVNGVVDLHQPSVLDISRIVVYGTKADDTIEIAPEVTIPATLNGGRGGTNFVRAGGGPSRLHGWFGHNTLQGGLADDFLVGRAGAVRFVPSPGTDQLFAGEPSLEIRKGRVAPPTGTFFRFVNDRLVPIPIPEGNPRPHPTHPPQRPAVPPPTLPRGPLAQAQAPVRAPRPPQLTVATPRPATPPQPHRPERAGAPVLSPPPQPDVPNRPPDPIRGPRVIQ